MRLVRSLALAATAVVLASTAAAAQQDDHQAHHPADAASATPATSSATPTPAPSPSAVQAQMKAMQDMHDRMMSAKTPDERSALMGEHMKAMRDGMSMMQGMHGQGPAMDPAARQNMMEMRMDMMQSMMQMMMDRMPPAPAK